MCNNPNHQFDDGDCCLNSNEVPFWDAHCQPSNQCHCYCSSTLNGKCADYDESLWKDNLICPNDWENDQVCDDECNHPQFNFDGGDCCSLNANENKSV